MNSSRNICLIRHGGHQQPGSTTFTVGLGFGVVVVHGVPARVCDLCSTDWLDDSVAEKLEQIVEQA